MAEAHATSSDCHHPRVATAPSGGRVVWTIAGRELMDQLTSLRFLIITLLVVGLTPLAVYVGARDYTNRLEDYNRLVAERQELMAGYAGQHVTSDLKVLRALRAPEPLSVLARGLDGWLPKYWDFSATGIVAGPLAARPARFADVLGQMDLEFLVRVVLGLLAILLAFDAVVGEKESGTLRIALSQPISRATFLTGKLAGGAITLLVPLAAAYLVALLSAKFFQVNLLGSEPGAKVALMAATSGTYLLCFYVLGLLISSLATSQKTSLVVLLVTWVLLVLATPPLATLVAQVVSPVPPADLLQNKKRALERQLEEEAGQRMGAVYREVTGLPEGYASSSSYEEHKEAINRRIAPIVVEYQNKLRRFVSQVDRDAERREARQNELARSIMALSAAAASASAAADLVGTGDASAAAWLESIRNHQSQLEVALFENPPVVMISNGGTLMWVDRRPAPAVADLPTFVPPRRDAAAAVARALPALGLLLLYTGLFIAGGFVAFARYDVR